MINVQQVTIELGIRIAVRSVQMAVIVVLQVLTAMCVQMAIIYRTINVIRVIVLVPRVPVHLRVNVSHVQMALLRFYLAVNVSLNVRIHITRVAIKRVLHALTVLAKSARRLISVRSACLAVII